MKLSRVVALFCCAVGLLQAASLVNSTGLASPAFTLTFDEIVFPMSTLITTQYSGFGITFSPALRYNSQGAAAFPGITGNYIGNNGPCCTGNPFSILFSSPVTAAAFGMATNPGTATITAKLNGTTVASFMQATTFSNPATGFLGFTGITFNEIQILVGGDTQALIDNIQTGTALTGCAHHTVHGHISTLPPSHSGTSAQHHGTHGHTVAPGADCPPHAPGHSPGLMPEPEPGLFASAAQLQPQFVAFINQEGAPGSARPGSVVQLFGSASGLMLGAGEDHPAAEFTPPASGSPLYYTTSLPEVTIGGLPAKVLFSGLAPGLKGVWQINVLVPAEASAGELPVTIRYEGDDLRSIPLQID